MCVCEIQHVIGLKLNSQFCHATKSPQEENWTFILDQKINTMTPSGHPGS